MGILIPCLQYRGTPGYAIYESTTDRGPRQEVRLAWPHRRAVQGTKFELHCRSGLGMFQRGGLDRFGACVTGDLFVCVIRVHPCMDRGKLCVSPETWKIGTGERELPKIFPVARTKWTSYNLALSEGG